MIQEDFAEHKKKHRSKPILDGPSQGVYYLILSVRYIIGCRINDNTVEYTQPATLLNGIDPPSNEAIKLLLSATQSHHSKLLIHDLSVELQDNVLNNVSLDSVDRT